MMLAGQTALVSGAGRGIGLAISRELAAQGCNVAMVARTAGQLELAAKEINAAGGGRALAAPGDVRDGEAVAAAVAMAEAELGPISLLVNNAGTAGPAGLEWEVDPTSWWECIESIVRGAFNCTQAVLPRMMARGGGRVVDVVSTTGTEAWPLATATSLAKTALIRRVEGLAASCAERGIHVFGVHPGMVKTDLLLSYRSHPALAAFLDTAPDEAFVPPTVAAGVVARIAAGDFDALSGRFVDATTDLDALISRDTALPPAALTLRLVAP
jgi:NAD(P)-dependent dehydrogenase (short-subunit alcohol dehydrogenase family)